ncbi:MAG TPA: L,D-transpeptidase family protein [Bacillota bacterium]|nr:L,D-transpeptidase family protein [Bacillota bacterium]
MLRRPLKFKRGDKGPFIVDIQEMLAKLGFDPGEPEGVFVTKTEDAVRVFQSEYGLPVTGIIDAKTLKLLYEEADPEGYPAALIEGEEMHPEEYENSEVGQGEPAEDHKISHGNEGPLANLVQARSLMTTGATDHAVVISLSERALGLYRGNQLIRRYPVAIGKPSTPTPVGTHRVLEKVLHPGGGLGTRWIGFTYQMHGIHGTNRPELIGQEVSNGCVRMYNANVEELYEMVSVGTPVVVMVGAIQSWSGLGKPTSQIGTDSGKPATGPEQAGKPGEGLDHAGIQPKDPKDTSQTPSPACSTTSDSVPGRTYTVQPGDSIWSIARRFGTTVDAIVSANKIRNPDLIYPGEVIKIP